MSVAVGNVTDLQYVLCSIVSCGRRLAMGHGQRSDPVVGGRHVRGAPILGAGRLLVSVVRQIASQWLQPNQAPLAGSRLPKIEKWAWRQCASENRIRLLVF